MVHPAEDLRINFVDISWTLFSVSKSNINPFPIGCKIVFEDRIEIASSLSVQSLIKIHFLL